jgi:hypothetical protein
LFQCASRLSLKKLDTVPPVARKDALEDFFVSEEIFEVRLSPRESGRFSSHVDFTLQNGEKRGVSVKYNSLAANCFIPARYYFMGGEGDSSFSILYVPDVKDPPVTFFSSSAEFEISKNQSLDNKHVLEIRNKKSLAPEQSGNSAAHSICVKLQSGKIVGMPVILQSKENNIFLNTSL